MKLNPNFFLNQTRSWEHDAGLNLILGMIQLVYSQLSELIYSQFANIPSLCAPQITRTIEISE